jgi:hypothetical protein
MGGAAILAFLAIAGCSPGTDEPATTPGSKDNAIETPARPVRPTRPTRTPPPVVAKVPSVGEMAPDITGPDTDGTEFKLADYRGKIVMVDFWGNW